MVVRDGFVTKMFFPHLEEAYLLSAQNLIKNASWEIEYDNCIYVLPIPINNGKIPSTELTI